MADLDDDIFGFKSLDAVENKTKGLEAESKTILVHAEEQVAEGITTSGIKTFQDAAHLQGTIHRLHLLKLKFITGNQSLPQPSPTLVSEFDAGNMLYSFEVSSTVYPLEKLTVDAFHILSLGSNLLKQGYLYLRFNDTAAASKIYADICDMIQAFMDQEKLSWENQRCDQKIIPRIDCNLRRQLDIYLSYAWNNRGYVFYTTSQHRQALLAFKHSYQLKKKLIKYQQQFGIAPTDIESLTELEMGKTLHNIGLFYHATSKYSFTVESFKEALHWKNNTLSKVSDLSASPTPEKYQIKDQVEISFVNTLVCFGCTLSIKCQWINIELNENIKLISRELHNLENEGDEFTNQEQGGKKKELEGSIKKYTEELKLKHQEALELYKTALPILQDSQNPQNHALAAILYNIGSTEYLLGHHKNAVDALKDAEKRLTLVEHRQGDVLSIKTLYTLGLSLLEIQEFQDADIVLQDALRTVNNMLHVYLYFHVQRAFLQNSSFV